MQCCGKERTTKFCPDCGKPTCDPWLSSLLAHLKRRADEERKRYQAICKSHESLGKTDEDDTKWLDQAKARADKWASWHAVLVDLIEKSG